MQASFRYLLLKAVVVTISLLCISGDLAAQHRVSIDPLVANVSYSYPISSRMVQGSAINVALTYSANVAQISFGEYTPEGFVLLEHHDESWQISTRLHGVWMLSVNGIVVQTFSSFPVEPAVDPGNSSGTGGEAEFRQWFTKGYDVCSRLARVDGDGDQDVISLLTAGGATIELRNETTYDDDPADDSLLYIGRYYQNEINSKGFAIVEYDDTYWPTALRELFDTSGVPPASMRPRKMRYYPGDGLEYVFREIVAPYGAPNECVITPIMVDFDVRPKREIGVTIFYLEEINREHRQITTVRRSKHYPSETHLDISPGRAAVREFLGHVIDYGDDVVTIQSEGQTHKLLLGQQDRFAELAIDSTYLWADSATTETTQYSRLFPGLCDNLRYPYELPDLLGYGTQHSQHLMVREIIAPSGVRTRFGYTPRTGKHDLVRFTSLLLTRVADKGGWTDVSYYTAAGHDYITEDVDWMLGRTMKRFHNVCSTLVTHTTAATDNIALTTTLDLHDGLGTAPDSIAGVRYTTLPNRWTEIWTQDHLSRDASRIMVDRYIWKRITVQPFFATDRDISNGTRDDLYYFYPMVHRTTTWDKQVETYRRDSIVDPYSLMNVATTQISTHRREHQADDFVMTGHSTFEYEYAMGDSVFDSNALDTAHRRFLTKTIATRYRPSASLAAPREYARDTTWLLNLGYGVEEDVWIKDTTILANQTKRALDSARGMGSWTNLRRYEIASDWTARQVTLAPLLGLTDLTIRVDSIGRVLRGTDVEWYDSYDVTGDEELPEYPRGGVNWTESIGESPDGTLANAPRIRSRTIEYRPSHFNMSASAVRGLYSTRSDVLFGLDELSMDILHNDGSTSEVALPDDDVLGSDTRKAIVSARYVDPSTLSTTTSTFESTSSAPYSGLLQMAASTAQPTAAARADDYYARTAHAWSDGDYPQNWVPRLPYIKLWDSQSEIKWSNADTTYTTTDQDRLLLMSPWELPPAATGDTGDIVAHAKIMMRYHAYHDDVLHSEEGNDYVFLRMNLAEMCLDDNYFGSIVRFDMTFSGGGLSSPVVQSYEVSPLSHAYRGPDSSRIGDVDFTLDSAIVAAMQAMDDDSVMTIRIELDTTLLSYAYYPLFIEFSKHAEDVAPRIIAWDLNTRVVHDRTTRDFTARIAVDIELLEATSQAKLDDSLTNGSDPSWSASASAFDGRYLGSRALAEPKDNEIRSATILGNPFAGTPDSAWTSVSANGLGDISSVIGPDTLAVTIRNTWTSKDSSTLHNDALSVVDPPSTNVSESLIPVSTPEYYGASQTFLSFAEDSLTQSAVTYNAIGQVMRARRGSGADSVVVRYHYADRTGRLDTIYLPDSQKVVFTYDAFGRLSRMVHPDLGPTRYKYDDRSQVRFVQTKLQAQGLNGVKRVTYYEYDDLGRRTLVGEAALAAGSTFESLDSSCVSVTGVADTLLNTTIYDTPTRTVPRISLKRMPTTCIPAWGSRKPPYDLAPVDMEDVFVRPADVVRYLGQNGQFTSPADSSDFEDIGDYPEHPRSMVIYDHVPNVISSRVPGAVFNGLPPKRLLECLAPTGEFRNTLGRVAAQAYRDHSSQAYWYKVYSYDHKGRVECEIRIDDGLGIGVTYLTYNSASLVTSVRTVDAIRNHATWYTYDNAGRVSQMRTALSASGPDFGLGLMDDDDDTLFNCYQTMTPYFAARPTDPDVVYSYDKMGRMTSKVYANAEPAGDIEHEWKFTWQGRLDTAEAFVDVVPLVSIAKESFEYRTDGVATKFESDARVLTDTTWAEYDEIARVTETTSTAFTSSNYEFDVLSRRTNEIRGVDPADTTRPHTYVTTGTVITDVTSDMDTTERVDYTWDGQGRASGRRVNVGGIATDESYEYGYHDRMLTLAIDDPERAPGCTPVAVDSNNNNYSELETWAYRYSPSGLREQKRLMTDWVHDRNTCGTAPWTHYVLGGSGRPLVVYHGRQTSENPCATDSFGIYDRRVYIYPFEFRAYGPDGVNVIFERDQYGEWVKRFVTHNRQGSIVGINDADGYQDQALYENYGSRHNDWDRRTGWLDRERDYETSPNSAAHKLYDLDHRKYDQSSATFLSVDPLWMSNLHQGSYVYCEGDGINLIDPWGLSGDTPTQGPPGVTDGEPGGNGGDGPTVEDGPTDPSDYSRWYAEWLAAQGGYGGMWPGAGAGGGDYTPGGAWNTPYPPRLPIGQTSLKNDDVVPFAPGYKSKVSRPWVDIARGEKGEREVTGKRNNPRIMEYHAVVDPKGKILHADEVAWCASFASWLMTKVGVKTFKSAGAQRWRESVDVGYIRLPGPEYGAIAISKVWVPLPPPLIGKWQFHVSLVTGITDKGRLVNLGGNQDDSVSEVPAKANRIYVGFYLPPGYIPTGYLPTVSGVNNQSLENDR